MKSLMTVLGVLILGMATLTLAGCNTVEGAGRDVQAVGEGVEGGARDTRRELE